MKDAWVDPRTVRCRECGLLKSVCVCRAGGDAGGRVGAIQEADRLAEARLAALETVADAARAVQENANPRPEYAGLVKIIVYSQDWQALADALDELDELTQVEKDLPF